MMVGIIRNTELNLLLFRFAITLPQHTSSKPWRPQSKKQKANPIEWHVSPTATSTNIHIPGGFVGGFSDSVMDCSHRA